MRWWFEQFNSEIENPDLKKQKELQKSDKENNVDTKEAEEPANPYIDQKAFEKTIKSGIEAAKEAEKHDAENTPKPWTESKAEQDLNSGLNLAWP